MRIFHCDHCRHAVFFENTCCIRCGHTLAYLPDLKVIASLVSVDAKLGADDPAQRWTTPIARAEGRGYRLCENYAKHDACNWTLAEDDGSSLCQSCRLTDTIPNLSQPEHVNLWRRLEAAKRRLVYSLVEHQLPITPKSQDPERGLAFRFLDDGAGAAPVLTGHDGGVITLNIAEADDVERERRRVLLHEPYRTLLGHFRHESGHYYWDRLIKSSPRLEAFRERFGDDRADYATAIKTHYHHGPRSDWRERFVSEYSSVHPWEDWAETWAHYLHITDTLETAAACGVSLQPDRADEPAMAKQAMRAVYQQSFEEIITNWYPLTYAMNNLNRGMGLPDAYPFVLNANAVDKLRFVHNTIRQSNADNDGPSTVHPQCWRF